jgi:hypothetical protein
MSTDTFSGVIGGRIAHQMTPERASSTTAAAIAYGSRMTRLIGRSLPLSSNSSMAATSSVVVWYLFAASGSVHLVIS